MPVDRVHSPVRVPFPFRPCYFLCPLVCLFTPFHVEIVTEHKRVPVYDARLREDDGFAVVERVIPVELAVERRKPVCREIRVEFQPRDGGLYQLDGDVPGVEVVQRLHLFPCDGFLGGDSRFQGCQRLCRRVVERNHRDTEGDTGDDSRNAPSIHLRGRIACGDDSHERGDCPDEPERHQPSIAGLLASRGISLFLQILYFRHKGAVGADIHIGLPRQFLKLLARQRGELLAKLVAVACKRFIDVLDQKNVPLACALISAEAVNGMRVV